MSGLERLLPPPKRQYNDSLRRSKMWHLSEIRWLRLPRLLRLISSPDSHQFVKELAATNDMNGKLHAEMKTRHEQMNNSRQRDSSVLLGCR